MIARSAMLGVCLTFLALATSAHAGRALSDAAEIAPCAFKSPNGIVDSVSRQLTVATIPNEATVTVSLDTNHTIAIAIQLAGRYRPIPGRTYIQYNFFDNKETADAWASPSGRGGKCDYLQNGLDFFTKWGNSNAIKTLPDGSTVEYDGLNAVYIRQPIYTEKVPFWHMSFEALCFHNNERHLALRIFNVDRLQRDAATGTCTEDVHAVTSLLPFYFECDCPTARPPMSPRAVRPPSPPPPPPQPPATSGPCGFLQYAPDGSGKPTQVATQSASFALASGGSMDVVVDPIQGKYLHINVTFKGFTPVVGSTYIQYKFFEGYYHPVTGLDVLLPGAVTLCNPSSGAIVNNVQWGVSQNVSGITDATSTVKYDNASAPTAAVITTPFRTKTFPAWNTDSANICGHQGTGGTFLGFRVFDKAAVKRTGKENCNDELPVTSGYFGFVFNCHCT